VPAESAPAAAAPAKQPVPEGSLDRDGVVEIVDQGLGVFLQRVTVEPSLEDGRFQGFRVLGLAPQNFWGDVDVRVGDVIVAVNDRSVESPIEAYEVFESLRVAPELRVSLVREGEPRQLIFPIVGAPQPRSDARPSDTATDADPTTAAPSNNDDTGATGATESDPGKSDSAKPSKGGKKK